MLPSVRGVALVALLVQNVQNGPSLLVGGATGSGLLAIPAPTLAAAGSGGVEPDIELAWSGYADTAEFLADATYSIAEREDADEMEVTTDVVDSAIGATKSLRYHYNHLDDGDGSITIMNVRPFGSNQQEVWVEFRLRWSTNFTTEQATSYPNDHKLFFIDTSSALSGRVAIYVGNGSGTHAVRVERPSASGGTGDYALSPGGEPSAETLWASDTWHTFRVYFKCSTTTSSADGAFKVWIDGVLYHDESGFSHAASEGGVDRLSGVSFCHNKDNGPENTDMYIWWSRVPVYFSDPGWT